MAKLIATVVGVVLILVGVVGFFSPNLLGAHLGKIHNAVHLVSGGASLYFGMKGSVGAARQFCILFGAVYLLLGIVVYFVGTGPEHLLHLPKLILGLRDHIIHIVVGLIYLIGGFATKAGVSTAAA